MKKKDNIFKSATQKLKNNRFLRAIILSTLLISNTKLSPDLVAQEQATTATTSFLPIQKENAEIQIVCDEMDKPLAEQLKNIIWELQDTNTLSYNIIAELGKSGTIIEITRESDKNNGVYLIGKNKISIPKNTISNNPDEKKSIKKTLIHETIHMIQDKNKIFDDCRGLSPSEYCTVFTLAELDATCKSYIVEEPEYWNTNSIFECLSDLIPCYESYTKKALVLSQIQGHTTPTDIKKVIEKFNIKGFDKYESTEKLIDTVKSKISPDLMKEIISADNEYNNKNKSEILLTQNTQKEF